MSNNEAIKMLKARLECVTNLTGDKCSYSSCADCHLCCEQGSLEEQKEYLDIAIKALEAWEKAREEIGNMKDNPLFEMVRKETLHEVVLEIIDKHLSEAKE